MINALTHRASVAVINSQPEIIVEDLLRCHYLISASLVDSQVQLKTTLNYLVKNPSATGEQMN